MVKNCHVPVNPLNLDLTKQLSLIISVRYTCQTDIKLIIHPVYPLVPRAAKTGEQNHSVGWHGSKMREGGRQRGERMKETKEPIKLKVLTWCFQQAHSSCPGSFGKRNYNTALPFHFKPGVALHPSAQLRHSNIQTLWRKHAILKRSSHWSEVYFIHTCKHIKRSLTQKSRKNCIWISDFGNPGANRRKEDKPLTFLYVTTRKRGHTVNNSILQDQ